MPVATATTNRTATIIDQSCGVCSGRNLQTFWEAHDLPVHCNVLCHTAEEALAVPRGDMRLAYCPNCGMIQNVLVDPPRMRYAAGYENSLHFSPRFQRYAETLAADLVERYRLEGKTILEIACGRGDFLRMLCRRSGGAGIGFDPSCPPEDIRSAETDGVRIVPDFYDERCPDGSADLICCRHALEHMADPMSFLRMVRRRIDRREALVFFEVPNALYTLCRMGIWDLIYEHCNYFVPASLRHGFAAAGFDVLRIRETFGGQFLTIEARAGEPANAISDPQDPVLESLGQDAAVFGSQYRTKVAEWQSRLSGLRRKGRSCAVWGSGSKGVTFLNILRETHVIRCVVDINPRKHGMYVPGTGHPIVGPEAVTECRPDQVVVVNSLYLSEVRSILRRMHAKTTLLTA